MFPDGGPASSETKTTTSTCDFRDEHPPKRFGVDGPPIKRINPAVIRSTGGGGCDWTGRLVRFEHGIASFFRRGCRAAPSPTPVPCSSIPPERARRTGRTQSGRILKSADPFEDRSEALSGHGDFRQLARHVLGVPGDLSPILTSFSFNVVSDHCRTLVGSPSRRRKFPRNFPRL